MFCRFDSVVFCGISLPSDAVMTLVANFNMPNYAIYDVLRLLFRCCFLSYCVGVLGICSHLFFVCRV